MRNDDEDVLAQQIVPGGLPLAGRRDLHRELAAADVLQSKGLLAPVDPATLATTPGPVQLAQRRLGRRLGPGVIAGLQHRRLSSRAAARRSVLDLADPKWKGKLALAPGETDFQPIVTSIIHTPGQGGRPKWLEAVKTNAGSHIYPDNETRVARSTRARWSSASSTTTTGTGCARRWARRTCTRHCASSRPRDAGYVLDVSGAGILKSSKHQAEAQQFVAFLSARRARRSSPTATATSTRSHRGSRQLSF